MADRSADRWLHPPDNGQGLRGGDPRAHSSPARPGAAATPNEADDPRAVHGAPSQRALPRADRGTVGQGSAQRPPDPASSLADAVDEGLISTNPAHRAHRLGSCRPLARTWTVAELRHFLDAMRADRDFPLWRLAATTGMRRGELLGLLWSDVDFARATVTVQRQLVRNGDRVELGQPKTPAGRRTVFVDPGTIEVLLGHKAPGRDDEPFASNHLIFTRRDGQPRDPDSVSQRFARQVRLTGLPHIRFHDLRHTHATLALVAGINPKVGQERLGHASVNVTLDTYTHVLPPMHEAAASRVAALIDEGP